MRRDCINTSNPDYIAIVQALKDAGVITAEFEAKRDYLEYGTFRNPEEVVAKVLTKMPEVVAFSKGQLNIAGIETARAKNQVIIRMDAKLEQRIENYLKSTKFGKGNRTIESIGKTKPFYIDDKLAIIRNKKGKRWLSSFTLIDGETGEIINTNSVLRGLKKSKYVNTKTEVSVKRSAVNAILAFNNKLNEDLKNVYGYDILDDLKKGNYERIDSYIDEIIEYIKDELIDITENNKNFNKQYLNKYNLLATRNGAANAIGAVYFKELLNDLSYQDALAKLKLIPDYFWNSLKIEVTDEEVYDPDYALPFLGVTTNNLPMLRYQLSRDQHLPNFTVIANSNTGYLGNYVDFEGNPISKKQLSNNNNLFSWLSTFAEKPSDILRFVKINDNYKIKAYLDNIKPEVRAAINEKELFEKVDNLYRSIWDAYVREAKKNGTVSLTNGNRFDIFIRELNKEVDKIGYSLKLEKTRDKKSFIIFDKEGFGKFKNDSAAFAKQLNSEIDNYFKSIPNFSFLRTLFNANSQFAASYTRELRRDPVLRLPRVLGVLIDKAQVNMYDLQAYVLFHELGHAFHLSTEVFGEKAFYNTILQMPEVKAAIGESYYSSDLNFKELVADVFALAMLDKTGILEIEANPFESLYNALKDLKIQVDQKTLTAIEDVMVERRVIKTTHLRKTKLSWDSEKTFLENIGELFNQIVNLIKQGYYMEQTKYFETISEKIGEQEKEVIIPIYKTALELIDENIYTMLNDVIPDSIHLTNSYLFENEDIGRIQNIAGKDFSLYMTSETITSPEEDSSVMQDLEEVALITNPERSNNPDVGEVSVKTAEVVDNANATANLTQLAEMLMVNLGVNYELVTAERAKQMLGDKYNGEPAFYYGDTVFFVGERLTMEMVFHEFSHPLVRAISKGNPQLFKNLYDSLEANSPDIIDYVKTEYPTLVEGTPAFMEEVIVTALGRMATLKSQNAPIEKGFAKVIKDILAAIKKMLRQLFGKVDVSTLDVDTSLDTLANMLVEGNRFALSQLTAETDTEAMFFKNTEQEVEELTRLVDRRTKNSTAQQAANIVYERTRRHIQELRFNKDYKEIAKLFRDQFGEAQYSIINKNLSKYQNLLEDKLQEIENDVEQAKNRADNVINTLIQIEIMAEKLDNYLNIDFDSVDNKDTLAKIMNYNKIIMSWENMITELKDIMRNAEYTVDGVKKRLSDKNATYDLVIRIGEKVGRIKERVNEIVTETTAETYEEILGPIQEAIDDKYKRLIDLAKSTNQPAWLIKSYEEEYAKITLKDSNGQIKDKIKKLLAGELNDANFLNSYLEGYMYNQDPVVFGLAKYIKDNYIDAINNAQRYYNEFATEMLPILEKLGFNPNNIRELGNILTFLDEDGFVDEKGVFQKRKVHTFLNANKNWRHDLAEWKNKIE